MEGYYTNGTEKRKEGNSEAIPIPVPILLEIRNEDNLLFLRPKE
jgi:hypothetical protein